MNIFVTDPSPYASAQCLPDKHVVKMPLETCQMLSIVCSDEWGHSYGKIHRNDGQAYKTSKGAFRNHPCTIWANDYLENLKIQTNLIEISWKRKVKKLLFLGSNCWGPT